MDRLTACYFCGDAFDASLSEYPVVPKALQPPEDGPSVVLCGDCRGKLGAVIEEVVAATEDGSATAATTSARRGETERADTAATNGAESTDASGSLFDDGADDEPASDGTTTAADEWASPTAEEAAETDTETPARDEATEPSTTATAADDGEPRLTKLEYNKVMRLLQNRPFPVDRAEIREVARSAYDIEPEEFDAVIEAAIERDLIAVENGQFVAPE